MINSTHGFGLIGLLVSFVIIVSAGGVAYFSFLKPSNSIITKIDQNTLIHDSPLSTTSPSSDFINLRPRITLISPKGGENLTIGMPYNIKFSLDNIDTQTEIEVALYKSDKLVGYPVYTKISPNIFSWSVSQYRPIDFGEVEVAKPGSDYFIKIYTPEGLKNTNKLPFNIVAPQTNLAPVILDFSANPSTVNPGESTALTFASLNSNKGCTIKNLDKNQVILVSYVNGRIDSRTLDSDTTFVLICVGDGGTIERNLVIRVNSQAQSTSNIPVITSVVNSSEATFSNQGRIGDTMTIYGNNFKNSTVDVTASGIEFLQDGKVVSNAQASSISSDGMYLKFRIPPYLNIGTYQVRVLNYDVNSSSFIHSNNVNIIVSQ